MTVAICLKCGGFKHGAFNPCSGCGYTPDDDESLTKHLLVTDHFLSRDELTAISGKLKAGEQVEFSEETLKEFWVSKADLDANTKKLRRGCLIGCSVLLALIVTLFLIFAWHPW